MSAEIKPIAILSDKLSRAIDHIQMRPPDGLGLRLREVNGSKRYLIRDDGQRYFIVLDPEQLLGMEISEILVVPGASRNPRYSEMYDLARTRIR